MPATSSFAREVLLLDNALPPLTQHPPINPLTCGADDPLALDDEAFAAFEGVWATLWSAMLLCAAISSAILLYVLGSSVALAVHDDAMLAAESVAQQAALAAESVARQALAADLRLEDERLAAESVAQQALGPGLTEAVQVGMWGVVWDLGSWFAVSSRNPAVR